MRTVRTSDNNVLINTSWTELNGYKELISDVYYYNYREGKYEFICHHQRPVARRYYHGYTDDNGTAISYNDYKELEYMSSMCDDED